MRTSELVMKSAIPVIPVTQLDNNEDIETRARKKASGFCCHWRGINKGVCHGGIRIRIWNFHTIDAPCFGVRTARCEEFVANSPEQVEAWMKRLYTPIGATNDQG